VDMSYTPNAATEYGTSEINNSGNSA
jgi:hypothetical protein